MSTSVKKLAGLATYFAARDSWNWARRRLSSGGYTRPRVVLDTMPYRKRYRRSPYARRSSYGARRFKRRRMSRPTLYRRRRYKTRLVGFPIQKGSTRKSQTVNYSGTMDSRTLLSFDMTEVSRYTDAAGGGSSLGNAIGIHLRNRNIINVRGFKIEGVFSADDNMTKKHMLNIALISERGCQSAWGGANTQFVPQVNFFKAKGGPTRTEDFSGQTGEAYMHLPINTDYYNVLMRKRITVSPKFAWNSASGDRYRDNAHSMKSFKIWFKLNRQVRFEDSNVNDDLATNGRVALVMWHDNMISQASGGIGTGLAVLQFTATCFWRPIS